MNKRPAKEELTEQEPPRLIKVKAACEMLGGIHPRTLSRLEKSGHIRSIKLLRHKLYAVADINHLVEGLRSWKA